MGMVLCSNELCRRRDKATRSGKREETEGRPEREPGVGLHRALSDKVWRAEHDGKPQECFEKGNDKTRIIDVLKNYFQLPLGGQTGGTSMKPGAVQPRVPDGGGHGAAVWSRTRGNRPCWQLSHRLRQKQGVEVTGLWPVGLGCGLWDSASAHLSVQGEQTVAHSQIPVAGAS